MRGLIILLLSLLLLTACAGEPDFVSYAVAVKGEHMRMENGELVSGGELLDKLKSGESESVAVVYVFDNEEDAPDVYSCELTCAGEMYTLSGDIEMYFSDAPTVEILAGIKP